MAVWWWSRVRVAAMAAVLGMGAIGSGWTTGVMAETPQVAQPSDPSVAFAADLAVVYRRVKDDGTPYPAQAPAMSMRLERRIDGGRSRSTVVYRDVGRPTARIGDTDVPLGMPFRISRVEIDEESGGASVFDARGRKVALPTQADALRLVVASAVTAGSPFRMPKVELPYASGASARPGYTKAATAFVALRLEVESRRRQLLAMFGPMTGQVRGLDRYVRQHGVETTEVLVQPELALPVEINVVADGALREHTEINYAAYGAFGHVRERVRTERLVGGGSTDRLITDVRFSNVAVAMGGQS